MTHTGSRRFTVLFAAIATLALAGALLALLFSPVQAQEGDAPAAPSGLASEVSHGHIVLSWDDPKDDSITGYRILRRETDRQDPGVFTTINRNTGSARTAYTDGTVEPETRYVYRVKAINAHGVSGQSNYADADTPAEPPPTSTPEPTPEPTREPTPGPEASEPPAAPQNLISAAAHDHVILSWGDPKDDSITGYRILRRETDRQDPGVFTTINRNTGSASTAYTDDTVEPETRYVYRVKAINAHGVSGQSNYADVDTPAAPRTARQNTAPSAPGNLKVADGDTNVTLRWDAPPTTDSITKHQYRYKTDADYPADWTDIPNSAPGEANASGYTVMGLTNGTAYTFQVRAHNGAEGEAATTAAVTPTVQISATIAAGHADATYQLDDVPFTFTLGTAAPTGGLTVSVAVTQDQPFLPTGRLTGPLAANTVTFAAGSTEQTLNFPAVWFLSGTATANGTLTATIVDGNGYEPGTPASADVAMKVFGTAATVKFELAAYRVEEDAGAVEVAVVVETAAGVPQPRGSFGMSISPFSDTATSGNDYTFFQRAFFVEAADYVASGSVFQARKTFMITILDDSLDEADTERFNIVLRSDPATPEVIKLVDPFGDIEDIITAFVDITDDDTRGVTVTPTSLPVDEGGSASYTVVLDSEPTDDVTVTPSKASGGDADITLTTTTAPTFTPSNWSIPQTITVSAEEDPDSDAGTATIEHSVTGGDYGSNSVTADSVTVTEVDDEAETGTPPISTDATLSSLTVSPVDVHGFASDRVNYHVGVASTVIRVTIIAEATDPQATVFLTDADNNAIADADAALGHQVDLRAGLNFVKVTVTARDTSTTKTYTVFVGRGVTAVYGWKAVDDVNTLDAAGNYYHRGIWSDGTTMWVADSVDDKLYAYDLSTKERDSDKDFDTLKAAGNEDPSGIWSDGTTMWVADSADDKLYAYDLEDKTRDSGKDFDTLKDAGNTTPSRLWSDGTTMWVGDGFDDKVYAYDLSTKERDSDKDFDTLKAAGNTNPSGIWSDGTTMWVADKSDDKLYAYDLDTKERVLGGEFDTLGAARNTSPNSIWSDSRTMWVADGLNIKLYSYNMPVSDNADLRTLTLDGEAVAGFDPATTLYSHEVAVTVTRVTVAAEARQLLAGVTGITPDDADPGADGHQVNLIDGRGTVTLTVTAQDGTTKTYTVNVQGDQSCNESDPGSLTVGGQASGEISHRPAIGIGDCDWFRVELAGGKTYQFDLKGRPTGDGTLADPMIFGTYDSEGTAVAYDRDGNRLYKAGGTVTTDPNVDGAQPAHWDNRDGGVGWNARLFFFVPSGQGGAYHLNVIGESGPGSYVLTAAEALTDEIGDDAENAKFILSRDSRSAGVIETPDDVDWFKVRLVASGVYNVEVLGESWGEDGETLSRPCLAGIYDHNSNLIADTSDDRGRLEFTAPASTAYYVAVCQNARGSAELPPGSYTVRITGVSVPQSVSEPEGEDFSADTSTAGFVVVGDRVRGKIESYTDADWFAVDLAGGVAYRFEMRGAGTEGNTLPKPRIYDIFDSTGTSLGAAAWTHPDDDNARVDFTPTATGRYYVGAFATFELIPEDGEFGTYALSVDER